MILSRQTLELCRAIVGMQQLQVSHPQFMQAAEAHTLAIDELSAAIDELINYPDGP